MDAEFGREVRNRARPQHSGVTVTPRARGTQVFLHPPVGVAHAAVERELRDAFFDLVDRDVTQQAHRVVPELPPDAGIELLKERRALVVPAPPQVVGKRREALVGWRDELSERASFADERRKLRSRHRQQADILLREEAGLACLHDEHALQDTAIDHGNAEERMVGILARFRKIFETRVRGRIRHDDRTHLLRDETDEAFARAHPDTAHAVGPQPNRGGEHEAGTIGLEQINGADVGGKATPDEMDDVGEGNGRGPAMRDEPADFVEGPKQRPLVGRNRVLRAHTSGG